MTMTDAEHHGWARADRILDQLLQLPPRSRRAQLAAMDIPAALRARVDRLLDAMEGGDGPLDHPERMLSSLTRHALSGRRLGRWELEAEIGRGGVAVVYRARSLEGPAGQVAALKILTLGALAEVGRDQFLREQEMLLRLRHPYIAPLHDAGIADDGTPWLAMALVEGARIDDWCAARTLDAQGRVRLVLQVCEAVAHAHRSLVIHRDIKPSNVLVDRDGRVRLLDFGIARLGDGGHERTATALRALTPEYAAPEQFTGAPASTAMDVYGIGALLYRLLAGVGPRPDGARDGSTTGQPPSRAGRGGAAPIRRLRRDLRGDLDAIVMKALAVDPDGRYASVDALSDDLRRWLDGRAVRAQPPGACYRLRKFVARHRLAVGAVLALVLVLAAGVAATLWQAGIARQQADRAQQAAETSQAQLAYLRSVLDVLAPATAHTRELDRHTVIAEAARRARHELGDRRDLLASVELSLGEVAQRSGNYNQAHDLFASALQGRRAFHGPESAEVGEALALLGGVTSLRDPSDPPLAQARLARAVALLRRHSPQSPELVRALSLHAAQLGELDQGDDASAAIGEAEDLCAGILRDDPACEHVWATRGQLDLRFGRHAQAIASLQRLLDWRGRHSGADHARTAFARGRLGLAYARMGERTRGIALLESADAGLRSASAGPTAESLLTLQNLAEVLLADNQHARALEIHRQCVELAGKLFGARSPEVALSLSQLGSVLFREARYREAASRYRASHEIYRELYGPRGAATAITLGNLADALGEQGEHAQALEMTAEALAGYREAFGEQSPRTGLMWSKYGDQLLANDRINEALQAYGRSLELLRGQPENGAARQSIAVVRSKRALALQEQGGLAEALAEARAAESDLRGEATGSVHHGLALGHLVQIACLARADDCQALRERAQAMLDDPGQPGGNHHRLRQALAGSASR